MNDSINNKIDEILIWVESNRDISTRKWGDEVLPIIQQKIKSLILVETNKARMDELKQLEPPEQYKDYAILMGQEFCQICGFNSEVFRRHIKDRIKGLKENK